jgi:hypothetical protein
MMVISIFDRVSNQRPNTTVRKGSFRQCSNSGKDSNHSRQHIFPSKELALPEKTKGQRIMSYYFTLLQTYITTALLPYYYRITTFLLITITLPMYLRMNERKDFGGSTSLHRSKEK